MTDPEPVHRPVPLGTWELVDNILQPTRETFVNFATNVSKTDLNDPLLTFSLPNSSVSAVPLPKIHRSRLISAGGPIAALVTAPFLESVTNRVILDETPQSFHIIRRFLYCLPIDMHTVPLDFASVADRWELHTLLYACFHWADKNVFVRSKLSRNMFLQYIRIYFPIIVVTCSDNGKSIRPHFAKRFAQGLCELEDHAIAKKLFGWQDEDAVAKSTGKKRKRTHETTVDAKTDAETDAAENDNANGIAHDEDSLQVSDVARDDKHVSSGASSAANAQPAASDESCNDEDMQCDQPGFPEVIHDGVWESLRCADMLADVVRYFKEFSTSFCRVELIDVIMRVLEPRLSDQHMLALIASFDWNEDCCADALKSPIAEKWPSRSWRLLALHHVTSRRNKVVVTLDASFRFSGGCGYLFTPKDQALVGHKRCEGYNLALILERKSTQEQPALVLNLWGDSEIRETLAIKISFVADSCSCDWESPFCPVSVDTNCALGMSRSHGMIAHTYNLMSRENMQQWQRTHAPDCDMVMRVSVKLQKNGESGDG